MFRLVLNVGGVYVVDSINYAISVCLEKQSAGDLYLVEKGSWVGGITANGKYIPAGQLFSVLEKESVNK